MAEDELVGPGDVEVKVEPVVALDEVLTDGAHGDRSASLTQDET